MHRMAYLILPTILLLPPASARSQERDHLADVLALQDAVHRSIARAEPSIACILVSRSQKYRALERGRSQRPGKLGGFNLRPPRPGFRENDPQFQELRRLDLSDPNNVPESYGSGVVIDDKEGLVLTLAHVVRNATKVYVRLPGGRGSWADIHASDPRSDFAVLRLIDRIADLRAIKLGDGGKLRKGDFVLSLSNPFAAGFADGSPSASWGIVSNLRRRATGVLSDVPSTARNTRLPLYCFNTLIQTDTRMNLGCSGGALLDLQGELVGLTSSLAGIAGGETPGGFAVPLDAGMRRIIDVLRGGGEVEYGFLGVRLMEPDRYSRGSVRIESLVRGGPLFRGLTAEGRTEDSGYFIRSINGTPLQNNDDLFLAVSMHLAGSTIRVEVSPTPDGPRHLCRVTLAKFPSPALGTVIASKQPPALGGLRVDWTSTLLAHDARGVPEGVVIREVLPSSAAEQHQLKPDMIIKSVNGRKVTTPAEFYAAMKNANGPIELAYTTGEPRSVDRVVTLDIK
jgi:serine protease Do